MQLEFSFAARGSNPLCRTYLIEPLERISVCLEHSPTVAIASETICRAPAEEQPREKATNHILGKNRIHDFMLSLTPVGPGIVRFQTH
jgi:hypothetical protein